MTLGTDRSSVKNVAVGNMYVLLSDPRLRQLTFVQH